MKLHVCQALRTTLPFQVKQDTRFCRFVITGTKTKLKKEMTPYFPPSSASHDRAAGPAGVQ